MSKVVRISRALALAAWGMFAVGCAAQAQEDESSDNVAESEDHLLAGRRLPESEVATHLRNAGFAESVIGPMVCTAKYESAFYERAVSKNRNGTFDRGLFQINSIHIGTMRGCPSNANALWDAATNAECAYSIYSAQGLDAWYAYQRHRTECNNYKVRSGSSASGGSSGGTSNDSSNSNDDAGACWSGTLQEMVDGRTCVQSKFDHTWYQCANGQWKTGVNGRSGPSGACSKSYPL